MPYKDILHWHHLTLLLLVQLFPVNTFTYNYIFINYLDIPTAWLNQISDGGALIVPLIMKTAGIDDSEKEFGPHEGEIFDKIDPKKAEEQILCHIFKKQSGKYGLRKIMKVNFELMDLDMSKKE